MPKFSIDRRRFLQIGAMGIGGGVLAACGGAVTPITGAVTSTTSKTPSPFPAVLRAGLSSGSVQLFVEQMWPEFAAERDVLLFAEAISATQGKQIFAAGKMDLFDVDPLVSPTIQAAEGGNPRIIGNVQPKNDYLIVANGDVVPTLQDLEGKRFGISSPGATSAVIPQVALEKEGVDFSSLELAQVGFTSQRLNALLSDQIDAAAVYRDAAYLVVEKDERMKILFDTGDNTPFVFISIHGWEDFLDAPENRDGIVRILMARAELMKWLLDNEDEFVSRYIDSQSEVAEIVVRQVYADYAERQWDPDLTIDLAELEQTMEIALNADPPMIGKSVPVADWVDTSFRDEAIDRLGGEGWWQA